MARNKLKRFLAGLCTAAMLLQTVGESGMTVFAADNEEVVTEATSENGVSEDAASEDEAEKEAVSTDEADADASDELADVSDNSIPSENAGPEDDTSDVDVEKQADSQAKRLIVSGKVYEDLDEDGELDSGETLLGTFDSGTGEFVVDSKLEHVPSFVFGGWEELKILSFGKKGVDPSASATLLGINQDNNGKPGGAFYQCKSLEKVDLSNAPLLTTIKKFAFCECTALSEVILNDELQAIENNAFEKCAISEITFGSSLIMIGNNAFQECKNLRKIALSSAATKCGTGVFSKCAIESFTLAKDDKGIVVFPENLFNNATFKEGAIIDIGADTVEISQGAFQNSNISHVKLSDKLTAINKNAFLNCKSLAEIDFTPCKETLSEIGESAFNTCTSLPKVILPDKVTKLGSTAFKNCIGITELKLSAGTQTKDSLGSSIFEGCTSLKAVEFPEGHEYVGVAEFYKCASLTDIKFSSSIKEIGSSAFKECIFLEEVQLPPLLTEIPVSCFEKCYKLKKCDLDGIVKIGDSAFYVCNSYMATLPSTLKEIGANAFNSSGFCGTLVLPKGLVKIGSGAFKSSRDSSGLHGHQELSVVQVECISDDLTCGTGIFNGCTIREIILPEGVTKIPANLFNQATWVTKKTIEIPANVVEIGAGAFAGNNSTAQNAGNLEGVDFSKCTNLQIIGKDAFASNAIMGDFVLPDSVKTIDERAFKFCKSIRNIVIPESVETLGASAFEGCSVLENVAFNAVAVTKSGKNIFKDCNLKNITIGSKVTILPDYLFEGAHFQQNDSGDYEMVSLTLPASVTRIGISSLTNVVNLKELKFESGSALKEIGQSALSGCTGLESITLPDTVTTIDNYAFQGCSSLAGIDLPKNLTVLGIGAFKGCVKVSKAHIPAGITDIKKEAFYGCSELSDLQFAEGNLLATIGESAFRDCKKITSIDIPETVKNIGPYAFSGCPLSGVIKLSEGFTTLGANAFDAAGENAKTTVYLPQSLRSIGNGAFNKNSPYIDNLEFYVVAGSIAEKWLKSNGFEDRIVGASEVEEKFTITFDLQGHGTAIPEVMVKKGEKLVKPADPAEEGWVFGGWFTEKACKTEYNFDKEVTKNITLYAKWTKNAENVIGGESAMDSTPSINAATTDLWVVKGQKFYLGDGWSVSDKTSKKYVSISKGVFKAKKETGSAVVMIHHDSRPKDIAIHISKPSVDKKLTVTITDANNTAGGKIGLNKDPNITKVLWYSASPDVATVDDEGNVKAVGKGKAKVTAYINGVAYTCNVTVKETVAAANRTMHLNLKASKAIKVTGVKGAWSVVSGNAASMNSKGNKVAASTAGTATLQNGAYTIDFFAEDITVKGEGVTPGKTNKYTINLAEGNSTEISFAGVYQPVVFKSSKPEVAYCDEFGNVVAKSKGTSKLTAKINGKTVTITVKVK